MLHTLSNSGNPVKWQSRAKPVREGVETRREWPKGEILWLRDSPAHQTPSGGNESCSETLINRSQVRILPDTFFV